MLANPHARKLASGSRMRALLERRARVRFTPTLEVLRDAAEEAVRAAEPVVVLAGGDGSYGPALTALEAAARGMALPTIALVPAGTACTVARNWGFDGGGLASFGTRDAERHAEALLEAASRGNPRTTRRTALRVRVDDGEPFVAFAVAGGFVSRFFERYEAAGASGYRRAFALASRIVTSAVLGTPLAREILAPVGCRIEIDGISSPLWSASLFCVSAVADVGLGLRVTYRAGEAPDRVHVVATDRPPRALAAALPRVLSGTSIGGVDALAARVSLTLDEVGTVVIDGDQRRARRVAIEPGPSFDLVRAGPA